MCDEESKSVETPQFNNISSNHSVFSESIYYETPEKSEQPKVEVSRSLSKFSSTADAVFDDYEKFISVIKSD